MELNAYQENAMATCMPSSNNFSYMFTNLVGEVGEFASKIAKAIRKEELSIGWRGENELCSMASQEEIDEAIELEEGLRKEAGDILWQLAGLCNVMGWRLEDVAQQNLNKLASRKQRGVIDGNGDER